MPGDTSGFDGPSASISLAKSGDRQRFTVELRPGETTIVSWKKLIKEANKASVSASVPHAPSSPVVDIPHQGQPADSVLKDEPPANRFNAVIEKIERLYKGNETSDEDLNDVPDDDQYDTDDSFIDDAELDDYFQVDNCSTKHNGFFVNKGKLEAMKESPLLPAQQPKKRRKKNISKAPDDDGPLRRKRAKVDKMTIDATILASGKSICVTSDNCASVNGHSEDRKHLNQIKRISADSTKLDRGISSKALNDVALVGQTETRAVMEKLNYGHLSKIPSNRVKDASGHPDPPGQKNDNRSHSDSQTDRKSNNFDGLVQPIKHKTKSGVTELKGMYLSDVKHAQAANTHQWHKKDGSNIKTKAAMLEKAIKELERMVAESRPPTLDVQDADMSGQAVKRRLPREIKQKLAKVARLAQANYGEVSEEVVNRLMGFLGHTMQLRTLKRNLRMMISSGLSAKQEKEVRSQQIKREVVELVSKEFEQQARMPDNFQGLGSDGKGGSKLKYTMNIKLEDKICDLYDLYVDGLEEDSGSQIRKLYAELAQLWPNGSMDNHGIKRAICRSKDRKRALHQQEKDSEQIRKRKLMTPKLVDKGKLGTTSNTNQQQNQPLERQTTDRDNQGSHFSNNSVVISTLALEAPRANVTTLESQKKEKVKASPNVNSVDDARIPIVKKKLKRRPELEFGKLHIRSEKLSAHVDDRQKPQKLQLPVFQQKSSSHSSASPGV
uniref:Hpc2-related domain-containing protein n=1 Tax=Kalanchoe fedtschenkoi TaxID=63787 RepID=A0A7N0TSD2_KALFE